MGRELITSPRLSKGRLQLDCREHPIGGERAGLLGVALKRLRRDREIGLGRDPTESVKML
jgi:hypothetical protein